MEKGVCMARLGVGDSQVALSRMIAGVVSLRAGDTMSGCRCQQGPAARATAGDAVDNPPALQERLHCNEHLRSSGWERSHVRIMPRPASCSHRYSVQLLHACRRTRSVPDALL